MSCLNRFRSIKKNTIFLPLYGDILRANFFDLANSISRQINGDLEPHPHTNTEYPYFVTIISHSVKETVFNILSNYIVANNFEGVYITKDTL